MNTLPQQYENETLRVIGTRRSIRMFTEQGISDEHLTAILRAAKPASGPHKQSLEKTVRQVR